MKRLIKTIGTIGTIGAMAILLCGSYLSGYAQTKETVKTQEIEKNNTDIVQVYYSDNKNDNDKLFSVLENRKGKIIIEVIAGTVEDNKGNGTDTNGYYIKYDKKRFKKGDKVQTVLVYNPNNNYIEDIVFRHDTLME